MEKYLSQKLTKEQYFFLAQLAEKTQKFEEMSDNMRKVLAFREPITTIERDFLHTAYKNYITPKRLQWRELMKIYAREESKESKYLPLLRNLKKRIEFEITSICTDILQLLETFLIPTAKAIEDKVLYLKMKGDYNRYIADLTFGQITTKNTQTAHLVYQDAIDLSEKHLKSTNAIYLSLILSFSVFCIEHLNNIKKGYDIAKKAYNNAAEIFGKIDDKEYNEAYLTMKTLRDNLNTWEKMIPNKK